MIAGVAVAMSFAGFQPSWAQTEIEGAKATPAEASQVSNVTVLSARMEADIRAARNAVAADPASAALMSNLVDALVRAGRGREAMSEADQFVNQKTATPTLRAQLGFLRRQFDDPREAVKQFSLALTGEGLTTDQRRNVEAGLTEARSADMQISLERAQRELSNGNFSDASEQAKLVLENYPKSTAAMRIRIQALADAGLKREALADADQFVERVGTSPLLRAQRGFLRQGSNDNRGAAEDFVAALAGDALAPEERRTIEAALAEARAGESQARLDRASAALQRRDFNAALNDSGKAVEENPRSEAAAGILIDTLSSMGRTRDAVTAADGFIAHNTVSAAFQARRGFLRREMGDIAGAAGDFKAALADKGLSSEQQDNVQSGLAEAQDATQSGHSRAAARAVRKSTPAEIDRLIAKGQASAWMYAERGFARRKTRDFRGAVQDFDAALRRRDLDRRSVPVIRQARAEAAAMLAERENHPQAAEASYRASLEADPAWADGWFKLGYLLLQQKNRPQGGEALYKGLLLRPVGPAYLDAANAYIFTNAPLASKLYRQGLDRWYAGDPSLAGRSEVELERVKNEVVEADATIKTNVAAGAIWARPESAGGTNLVSGAETRMRFDGRFLPAIPGLEAFTRGFSGKDSNGIRETDVAAGLRYRPFPDLNLYVGGMVDQFFQPNPLTEFVLTAGLGLGADPYPYTVGWKPYWDFATVGAWRTTEQRVLADMRLNAGFLYGFRSPIRGAIGPSLLAVGGYDNKATNPWAGGIGPSMASFFWLGGDKYRSYDAILSLQIGYLVNIGADERQRGWRAQIGLTF